MPLITINNQTDKSKLLSDLITISKNKGDDLYIDIESLPKFLLSEVSIQVFIYQLSSYPKTIYWFSDDPKISNILARANVRIKKSPKDQDSVSSSTKMIRVIDSQNEFDNIEEHKQYIPSILISDNSENIDKKKSENSFSGLIDKINQTKKNLKTSNISNPVKKNSKFAKPIINISFRKIFVTGFSILAIIILAGLLVWWQSPKVIYTVAYEKKDIQSQTDIEILTSQLSTINKEFSANKEIITTSTQTIPGTDTAVGQIKLVNNGNKGINLNNVGFKLDYGDVEVSISPNNNLPKTFFLPANYSFNESTLVFEVKASKDVVIPKNQKITITNLQNRSVCGSCYAEVSQEVIKRDAQTFSVFTSSEKNLLDEELEKDLKIQVENWKTQTIKGDWVVYEDWIKEEQIEIAYSSKIGERTDKVTGVASLMASVSYLSMEALTGIIAVENQDVLDLSQVRINEVSENTNNLIININYTYYSREKLQELEVSELLEKRDFDEAKNIIQEKNSDYNIEIDSRETGINILGVEAEKRVEFQKKD